MNFGKFGLILLFLTWFNVDCLAQVNKDTLNVLFVGNSYTFVSNIPQLVSLISDSTNTKLITLKSTAPGARLSNHWKGEKGLKTKEMIKDGDFDIVVLQEQSRGTFEYPDSFFLYSKKLCEYIKEFGAEPLFYETWARQKLPQEQEIISKRYSEAASENGVRTIKVGEAWALAKNVRPNLNLYLPDGKHQSSLGAFLASCMFVGTLTEELPEDIPSHFFLPDWEGEEILLMSEDSMDIKFCIKVASEILRKENPNKINR